MAIVWLVVGVALLAIELHHLAFYALFGAVAALAAAIVATQAADAIALQGGVACGVAILGVVTVRPLVSRAYDRRHHTTTVARGVHGGLIGQHALTLDVVGHIDRPGHARLAGERWLAVSVGEPIAAGTAVLVTGVTGTTLSVLPVSELGGPWPDTPGEPQRTAGRPDRPDRHTDDDTGEQLQSGGADGAEEEQR